MQHQRKCQSDVKIVWTFFTFSTIKGQINHSDLDKLELSEKRRMLEWAQNGYPVKVIISLQPSLICEMSYDLEQYDERCADLERSLTSLEDYKNVQFVVDDVCELDSLYILIHFSTAHQEMMIWIKSVRLT